MLLMGLKRSVLIDFQKEKVFCSFLLIILKWNCDEIIVRSSNTHRQTYKTAFLSRSSLFLEGGGRWPLTTHPSRDRQGESPFWGRKRRQWRLSVNLSPPGRGCSSAGFSLFDFCCCCCCCWWPTSRRRILSVLGQLMDLNEANSQRSCVCVWSQDHGRSSRSDIPLHRYAFNQSRLTHAAACRQLLSASKFWMQKKKKERKSAFKRTSHLTILLTSQGRRWNRRRGGGGPDYIPSIC